MAYFYSLRGWLEAEPDNFEKIVQVIKSLQKNYSENTKPGLYMRCWTWTAQNEEHTHKLTDGL